MSNSQIHKKVKRFLRHHLGLVLLRMGFVERQVKKVRSKNLITVLGFHNPSAKLFADCTKWLIDNKYVFISVQELYDILFNGAVPPVGSVCLTIDDGWRDNLSNLIPVINDQRIPISIFISTKPVEDGVFWWSICARAEREGFDKRISIEKFKAIPESERAMRVHEIRDKVNLEREAMTKDEVIEISKNRFVTIGSHTVNHASINQCTDKELIYELTESKRLLSEWIQKEICFFSYPNGDFKGTERKILAENGYLLAFTGEEKFLLSNQCELYYLPKLCINDGGSLEENICKMTGVWQTMMKHIKVKKYRRKQRA